MSAVVVLRRGEPVVFINSGATVTVTQVDQSAVAISRAGTFIETTVQNEITEVTHVVEPPDPGDLTLIFENRLI